MGRTNGKIKSVGPGGGKKLDVLGDEIFVKLSGEDTDGAFAVIEELTPPGGGPPLHMHHREDEAFYVLDGEYDIRVGDRVVRARSGAFAFLPREIPHTFQNVGTRRGGMLVTIIPAGFERFFEEVSGLSASGPPHVAQVVALARKYELEILGPPSAK